MIYDSHHWTEEWMCIKESGKLILKEIAQVYVTVSNLCVLFVSLRSVFYKFVVIWPLFRTSFDRYFSFGSIFRVGC